MVEQRVVVPLTRVRFPLVSPPRNHSLVRMVFWYTDAMFNTYRAKKYLRRAFIANPSYSFNNWRIMYHHSLLVMKLAKKIGREINCDMTVITIGALLHDIGKTFRADEQTLHADHDKLGYEVSKNFLATIYLTEQQHNILKKILSGPDDSIEKKIIEDADVIAFFADLKLQTAFKAWIDKNQMAGEMERKLNKFNSLHFEVSKKLAQTYYQKMKNRWGLVG